MTMGRMQHGGFTTCTKKSTAKTARKDYRYYEYCTTFYMFSPHIATSYQNPSLDYKSTTLSNEVLTSWTNK